MSTPRPLGLPRAPWQQWVTLAARLILGIVLLVAGALKVGNLESSVLAVRAYALLPFELTRPLGYALPIVEVAVGLMLVVGVFTRIAAIVGAGLMLAFVIGIASVWARGISIDCGCFGGGGAVDAALTQYPAEIARDLGLLACGVWGGGRGGGDGGGGGWGGVGGVPPPPPPAPWAVDTWLLAAPDSTIPEPEMEDVR